MKFSETIYACISKQYCHFLLESYCYFWKSSQRHHNLYLYELGVIFDLDLMTLRSVQHWSLLCQVNTSKISILIRLSCNFVAQALWAQVWYFWTFGTQILMWHMCTIIFSLSSIGYLWYNTWNLWCCMISCFPCWCGWARLGTLWILVLLLSFTWAFLSQPN
jgi:hypothetical protein